MKELTINNIVYRIGRSAADNTQLIRESNPDWLWLHLNKFPSCHVVVCTKDFDDALLRVAGALVKEHSRYKFKNIGVNYCKISNLVHGTTAGSVSFVSNREVALIYV